MQLMNASEALMWLSVLTGLVVFHCLVSAVIHSFCQSRNKAQDGLQS